jgi:hypothetical protein
LGSQSVNHETTETVEWLSRWVVHPAISGKKCRWTLPD